ncbi:heavy-metal resistance protein [Arcicella aurantiaca]|uniref:Heavy-metal resistance protein n=1 Tax=Arcicella aurantiaca TaxID=591202 RepID=A0A316EA03_9BACT|nr:periplasmic heavy metal sensor [Arcicella aurantiaca]PWK26488.1 heavy-metal resistance protein [Arcicella aurantiaca]
MEDVKKIKTLWIAIIMLIAINLSVLTWLWFSPKGTQGQMSPERIERTLNFDNKQSEQFEIIKDKHFAEVIPIRDSIKIMKSELLEYIKQDKPDPKVIDEKMKLLTGKIKENEEKTLKHFSEIRALCNEDQKQVFDNDVLERFKKQGPREKPNP